MRTENLEMTIVPMLRVGMQFVTLCVTDLSRAAVSRSDAERPELRYHAERGSDDHHRHNERHDKQKRPEQVGAFLVLRGYQLSRLRVSSAGFSPRGRVGNWSSCSADGKRSILDSLCTIFG